MSDRRVKLILEAQVDRYKAAMSAAARSTEELEKAAKETDSSVAKRTKALRDLSPMLIGVGTATLAGLGASTKAAMDWESAWTGVMKTVDGTPAQLSAVEDGLRGLARELPASHTEIAAVAEAAGQLGVATPDVVDFTRTMINLGESTNLSAEEAATTLARFANVMGTSTSEMENLGAAIVGLGNSYATTESEIASLGQRLSGAGRQVGLSEGEVLGLAAAMSSVGIEAEAGGTAMSMTMKRIQNAVSEGGDSLDLFAQTSGMSSAEFQQAWRDDAGGALALFVEGLGAADAEGRNVNGVLTELGITGQREADSLLRLSAEAERMGEAMRTGAEEFDKGSALVEEAQKRYETAESRIKIAWNTIKDAAIDAGAVILPAVAGMADAVAGLVGWFADLPAPVRNSMLILGGLAGVGIGAVGMFVKFAPVVRDTHKALKVLVPALNNTSGSLGKIGKAGAAVGVIAGLGFAAAKLAEKSYTKDIPEGTGHIADALAEVAANGPGATRALEGAFESMRGMGGASDDIDGLQTSIDILFGDNTTAKMERWAQGGITAVTGIKGSVALAEDAFVGLDTEIAAMVQSGNLEGAEAAMDAIAKKLHDSGVSAEDAAVLFPQYADALHRVEAESKNAAAGSDVLGDALEEVGVSADGVVDSMATFLEQLFEAGILTRTTRDAQASFEESIDSVDEAVKTVTESEGKMGAMLNKNKTDFDLTTEAGRLANGTFHDIANAGNTLTTALAENGAEQSEVQASLRSTYDSLIEAGRGMGLTKKDAEALTREVLGIPDDADIDSWMDHEAKRTAEATSAAVDALDGRNATVTTTQRHVRTYETHGTPFRAAPATSVGDLIGPGFYKTKKAAGGSVVGPGTETSDSIPAMLSNGEYVLTAADVRAMGGPRAVDTMRTGLHGGAPSAVGMLPGGGRGAPIVSGRDMVSAANQGPRITVNYYVSNPVAEPASKTTENASSHLTASLGGI
ncbi:phage tail tape measure protein [Kocuria polaris]|nr:phage tail tape measure protein [Kocuria polaris]